MIEDDIDGWLQAYRLRRRAQPLFQEHQAAVLYTGIPEALNRQ